MTSIQNDIPFSPRPELDRFQPYKPGLSIQEIQRRYGIKRIIKLASNENPLGPSRRGLRAYRKAAEMIFRYPESRSLDLRQTLAERFKVDLGEIIIGAGSDEIIELLAKTFLSTKDEVVVSESGFKQYEIAANLMGARVLTVPMKNMKVDLVAMAKAATPRTRFVFLANPNNPTGTYNAREEVERFLKDLPANVIPVFDEAYFEYAAVKGNYPSMIDEYFRYRPMVVLRTFSKIYGLAGLRVGYGVAPEGCISAMDRIRPPFNVSIPAQAAAHAALRDLSFIKKSVALNEHQKKFLQEELRRMGFEVIPSAANFILFRASPLTGHGLFEKLLLKGIIARSVDEYGLPGHLRVTIGKKSENKMFLAALREVANTK